MDIPALIRAARRTRGVSQRELAERADVPRSTVDRIEAGRSEPKVSTLEALLDAIGYELVICTRLGHPLEVDHERERLVDRSGRHFPPHWGAGPVDHLWWGWSRVAWWPGGANVPENIYWKLSPSRGFTPWEDAT